MAPRAARSAATGQLRAAPTASDHLLVLPPSDTTSKERGTKAITKKAQRETRQKEKLRAKK